MAWSSLTSAAATALLLAACAHTSAAPDLAAVEREIAAVDAERLRALQADDVAALSRLYADDFIMVTSTGDIRTKADQLRDIGGGRMTHPPAPQRTLQLRVYGDVAVLHSQSEGGLAVDGKADATMRRFTRIYAKRDGRWQLVATHISQVPH